MGNVVPDCCFFIFLISAEGLRCNLGNLVGDTACLDRIRNPDISGRSGSGELRDGDSLLFAVIHLAGDGCRHAILGCGL